MALVNFKKGLLQNLPATKTAGTFYVTTDERAMYLDVDATTRIRLGDFQEFATVAALTANANPNTSALYYVSDINCLAKWNGSEYIQINKDTGMTSVEVTGDGNAITAAVYDASGRKLTLTKGATYMTAADVDGKISDKVGTLKIGDTTYDTVTAFVNKKAEETLAAAQGGSSETAASVKAALDNYITENDAKVQANSDAIDAIEADYLKAADKNALQASIDEKASQSDLTALENKVGTVPTDKTVVGLISDAQTQADKGVADAATAQAAADAAQADVDALEDKVGTVPDGKTVVQMIADAQTAATYDDTALAARVSTIEGDYLKAADKTALQSAIDTEKARAEAAEQANATAIADVKSDVDAFFAAADVGEAAIDTLKEIQDYITSDGAAAAEMTSNIAANASAIEAEVTRAKAAEKANADAIDALEVTVGDASSGLVKSVADNASAIAAEKTRAEGAESALSGRVDTLEAIDHSVYALKTDVATDKSALQGNIDAVSARVKTIEDKNISDGANKVEASTTNGNIKIDGVETVVYTHPAAHTISEVTGLQDALDAKATVTALNAEADRAKAAEKVNSDAIAANATEIAKKANSADVYLKTETYTKDEVDGLLTWGSF